MARIRTIKPEFWSDKTMSKLPPMTRLFFIALWNFADDAGRARALARELAGFAFPYDDDVEAKTVNSMLDELAAAGRILLYEVADMRYYQIVNWKHQVINKPTRSRHPAHPDHSGTSLTLYIEECSSTTGMLPEECSSIQGTEDGRRKTEDGNRKLEDGNGTTEGGPGETAAPQAIAPASVSVRPSVFLEQAPFVPSPELARKHPDTPEPRCRLTDAEMQDLLRDRPARESPCWSRQEIDWGLEIVAESSTVPRKLKALLHSSILPEVRAGKKPARLALAPPDPPPTVPEISPESRAKLDQEIAEQNARIQRAKALRLAREAGQNGTGAN